MISANWIKPLLYLLSAAWLLTGCSSNPRFEEAQQASIWVCDGTDIMETRQLGQALWLQLPQSDEWLLLTQARAASGSLYRDEQGSSFWNQGNRARVETPQKTWLRCQLEQSGTAGELDVFYIPGTDHSPEALTLRATGHNPRWTLEVRQNGKAVLLQNFGTRSVQFKGVKQVHQDMIERRYEAMDDQNRLMRYQVDNVLCIEVGSGEPFPHRVRVEYQNQEYRGCGQSF
ncbi:MAG: MliC family protein [Marinospirillum sp.]|uniref:MliC family protein n=1 Tax=Marinospirillum sp. TaxID=2183934 RepID=UPI0019FF40D2|nr:MliC family protein [Marinospirillum sp.]MBE0506936.1 MliC family protein [Marinospirillum sp.]